MGVTNHLLTGMILPMRSSAGTVFLGNYPRSQAGEVRKDITDEECQGGCVQAGRDVSVHGGVFCVGWQIESWKKKQGRRHMAIFNVAFYCRSRFFVFFLFIWIVFILLVL